MKRALILSGGGLFGAWQVGAWSVLRDHFQPDVIIGASIGSLNGWAIAGGCGAEELAEHWHEAAAGIQLRFRLPQRPLDGFVEFGQIEGWIRRLYSGYTPSIEYHAVITDLLRLTPKLVAAKDAEWRHLAASCALLGLLPQQRIDRRIYSDGGMLGALPLWAAVPVKATHVIGLNVMPKPPWAVRAALKPFGASRHKPQPEKSTTFVLSPSKVLGTWKDALLFRRKKVDDWIDLGRRDAAAFIATKNISLQECFAR